MFTATRANVVSLKFRFCHLAVITFNDLTLACRIAFKCTFEGCNRTFSVQSNMRRHARTHSMQSGNEARESEGEDESEEGSPQPLTTQVVEAAPPR